MLIKISKRECVLGWIFYLAIVVSVAYGFWSRGYCEGFDEAKGIYDCHKTCATGRGYMVCEEFIGDKNKF